MSNHGIFFCTLISGGITLCYLCAESFFYYHFGPSDASDDDGDKLSEFSDAGFSYARLHSDQFRAFAECEEAEGDGGVSSNAVFVDGQYVDATRVMTGDTDSDTDTVF